MCGGKPSRQNEKAASLYSIPPLSIQHLYARAARGRTLTPVNACKGVVRVSFSSARELLCSRCRRRRTTQELSIVRFGANDRIDATGVAPRVSGNLFAINQPALGGSKQRNEQPKPGLTN